MIIYAISVIEDFRNNDNKNDNKAKFKNEDAFEKVLLKAARFDLKSKIKELSKSIVVKDKSKVRKSRNIKFKKLLRLSNIYINLYLTNNAREYITIINSNILTEELKYKLSILFSSY